MEFTCQAGARLAFGDATQQEHESCWPLPGFGEGGVGQQRVIAVAGPAAIARKRLSAYKEPSLGTAAVRTHEPVRVNVLLQPGQATGIVEQVSDRKVNHGISLPRCAS